MSVHMIVLVGDLIPLALACVIAVIYATSPLGRARLSRVVAQRAAPRVPSDSAPNAVLGAAALVLALSALIMFGLALAHLQAGPFSYAWWHHAQELLLASVALIATLTLLALRRSRPDVPVPPTQPRTWRTYIAPKQLWLPGCALIALLTLVVFAGSVSSPDEEGIYRVITIDSGSDITGSGSFFGWAYGVPVALVALVFTALAIPALHVIATRPFLRPDSVLTEEAARRSLATRILWFVAGVLLLTLGRSLIMVGDGARGELHTPEYEWGTSIAALSPWLRWAGMLIKLYAYTLLLLVVGTTRFWMHHTRWANDATSSFQARITDGTRG